MQGFFCPGPEGSCPNKNLREVKLQEILWDVLQKELLLAGDLEQMMRRHSRSTAARGREAAIKHEIDTAQHS